MYKKILFGALLAALSTQSVNAQEQATSIEDLQKEITALKEELKSYSKKQKENRQDIEDLYDYTEKTETLVLQDKLKLSLGYKVNMDNFSKKLADGTEVRNNSVFSSKFMLNIKADIAENMKFYTRFSMYKYWGNGRVHQYSSYDNMQGRVPSVSTLFVERAYFDWFLNREGKLPFALTIGRLPTSDGPSQQFKANTTRKGTYSALLYDGASDGIVGTINLSKVTNYDGTYLRLGYAKGYLYTEQSPYVTNAFIGTDNKNLKDTDVYGIFLDTKFFGMKRSLIQLSYSKMFNVIANQLDPNSKQNTNLGDFSMYGAMLELNDIKETGLDLFTHFGYSQAYPNGNSYANFGSLLSNANETDQKNGYAVWVGTRYALDKKKTVKLGAEYNHGSKNWTSLTQGAFDFYNKLSTRGDAYEAYLIYEINRNADIRIGYLTIDYKYSKSAWFVGESQEIANLTTKDVDRVDSFYLKMSINY